MRRGIADLKRRSDVSLAAIDFQKKNLGMCSIVLVTSRASPALWEVGEQALKVYVLS